MRLIEIMNDVKGFTVTFSRPLKSEEAIKLAESVSLLKGVEQVDLVVMQNASEYMDRLSIRRDILRKIYEACEKA